MGYEVRLVGNGVEALLADMGWQFGVERHMGAKMEITVRDIGDGSLVHPVNVKRAFMRAMRDVGLNVRAVREGGNRLIFQGSR